MGADREAVDSCLAESWSYHGWEVDLVEACKYMEKNWRNYRKAEHSKPK